MTASLHWTQFCSGPYDTRIFHSRTSIPGGLYSVNLLHSVQGLFLSFILLALPPPLSYSIPYPSFTLD